MQLDYAFIRETPATLLENSKASRAVLQLAPPPYFRKALDKTGRFLKREKHESLPN